MVQESRIVALPSVVVRTFASVDGKLNEAVVVRQ